MDVRIEMQGYSIGPNDRLLIVAPADLDEDVAEDIAKELRATYGDRVLLLAGAFDVRVIPFGSQPVVSPVADRWAWPDETAAGPCCAEFVKSGTARECARCGWFASEHIPQPEGDKQ